MEPHILPYDKQMFYKYLDKAKKYFEFGSGGSTYQASIRQNIEKIYSVESMLEWISKLKEIIPSNNKLEIQYIDLKNDGKMWGYPGLLATNEDKKKYSDAIIGHNDIDLVLIDGRFRVACALKTFITVNDDCLVIIDDFINRPEYHILKNYFIIIETTINNSMVVLKKKKNIKLPSQTLIQYYELDPK